MCGSGDRMYSASMSGLATRLCSICSMSAHSQLRSRRAGGVYLLVTLWFKISSSLTALSSSFLLPSSTTRTFHCEKRGKSGTGRTEQRNLAYIVATGGTDRVQDDYIGGQCWQLVRAAGERGGGVLLPTIALDVDYGGAHPGWRDTHRMSCW